VPKPPAPGVGKDAEDAAHSPTVKVAGNFGQWALM